MAYSGGLEGIPTGLTKSTDHPSRAMEGPILGFIGGILSFVLLYLEVHGTS